MVSLAISSSFIKAPEPSDLYFKRHKLLVAALIGESMHGCASSQVSQDIALMVAGYVVGERDCFGAEAWMKHWECDIVEPEKALDPFKYYRFWFSPDPKIPGKQVCDTHIPPVLKPRIVMHIPTGIAYAYNLEALGQLI